MNSSFRSSILFLIILSLFFGCLEDETDDFTSVNHYPVIPVDTTTTKDPVDPDTTVTPPPPPPLPCWDSLLLTSRDQEFINLFTRSGGGWTGGDATYSIALPDGRTLWIFGDTFLGTVREDRSRPGTGLVRNTFVVQEGDNLTTINTDGTPMVTPPDPSWWYWPVDGTVYNDTLQVLLSAFRTTPEGGMWGFEYASIDLALFTLPDLELISIERVISEPTISFGSAVMESDSYIYIYGNEGAGGHKYAHVARAPAGDLRSEWEYFDGSGWSSDPAASSRLVYDVSEQFAVFEYSGFYYLLTHHYAFGDEIYLYRATNPTGPWENKQIVYCTPESGGNIFTYNSFAHPQFIEDGSLLISYNINSFVFADLFSNADNYRPYFIRISNWQ